MTRLSSKSFQAEGIVIAKKNFFEADRIVEVLTLEKGRVRAIVKGARRPKSKLSGSTEIFTHGVFTFAKGKNLDIVTAVTPLDYFQKATNDLKKVSRLFLISEILEKILPREVPNKEIFEETLNVFRTINRSDKIYVAYEYIYKLVVLLGYGLSLSECSRCDKKIVLSDKEDNTLSFVTGGTLCKTCETDIGVSLKLSSDTIKLLKYIEKSNFPVYSKVSFNENVKKEIVDLVTSYSSYIYQKEFKSSGFIKSVKALK